MNEAINLLTLKTSGNRDMDISVFNLSGQATSINITGIKNINLGDSDNIIINNTPYKEIPLGLGEAKILGNAASEGFFNNYSGLYVNGIKFVPENIEIEGVIRMVLVAEE